jgi:hypothetical protein
MSYADPTERESATRVANHVLADAADRLAAEGHACEIVSRWNRQILTTAANPDVTDVQAGSNTAGTDYRRGFGRVRVSLSITNVMANAVAARVSAVTLALVADTASVRSDDRVASRRRSRTPPAPFAGACDNGK